MNCLKLMLVMFVVCFAITIQNAKSAHIRMRRVSDQRLAELETLLALEKIRGRLVSVPLAFGRLDPMKIGRRKRSIPIQIPELNLDKSELYDQELESANLNLPLNNEDYYQNILN